MSAALVHSNSASSLQNEENKQLTAQNIEDLANHSVCRAILNLYDTYGSAGYGDQIHEAITQTEHAVQAAYMAKAAGSDDEVIIAALLHDVGHLRAFQLGTIERMGPDGNCGAKRHEHIGADYLKELGLPDRVCTLVRRHVDAKRYLTYSQPNYINKLSDASRLTLIDQGGPMSKEEAEAFDLDPMKKTILLMRTWDEKAKQQDWKVPGMAEYLPLIAKLVDGPRN